MDNISEKIVVVESDAASRASLVSILESAGWEVSSFSTAREGLDAMQHTGADLFLHISDLKASGIDPDGIRIGDRLTFETVTARKGGMKASNVRRA